MTKILFILLASIAVFLSPLCLLITNAYPLIRNNLNTTIPSDSLLFKDISDEANGIDDLYSLVVWQNEKIIYEKYFRGNKKEELNNTQSVTKSVLALLIGIAIEKGYITDEKAKISNFIKVYHNSANKLNIENLLTMTGGFYWDENSDFVPWITSRSQIEFIVNRELEYEPGTIFEYNSAAAHLLSVIIERVCGMETDRFAIQNLFNPLDIKKINWPQDFEDYTMGATGLALSPVDMVRIGELVLDKGILNNRQIIDSNWINKIIYKNKSVRDEWGELEDIWYGYMWWTANIRDYITHFAWGYGGQFIFVIPELKAVVVTSAKWRVNADDAASTEEEIIELIKECVVPLLEIKDN